MLIILVLGLLFLLLPSQKKAPIQTGGLPLKSTGVLLHEEAAHLAQMLSEIQGVGETRALLSESGAVIICRGADSAQVRLSVSRAVSAFTGLGSDQIVIEPLK